MEETKDQLWAEIAQRISEHNLKSTTWNSDRKILLLIFEELAKKSIDPSPLLTSTISNIRTIIRPLRTAIDNQDIDQINSLIIKAKTLRNSQLRLEVHTTDPEIINIDQEDNQGQKLYILRLNEGQFERIKRSTKLFFKFQPKE